MTEYQFKKREAEFEKEHEHDFKETSDADYLHEKIYFYYQICKELLKENKRLKKFENRYYDAFRGLCRMRIKYAQFMSEGFEQMNINETITEEWVSKKMKFWAKVKAYWEGKLELSYKWEKDYFGR